MPIFKLYSLLSDAAMDALVMVEIWQAVKNEVGSQADQLLRQRCFTIERPSSKQESLERVSKRRTLAVKTTDPCEH